MAKKKSKKKVTKKKVAKKKVAKKASKKAVKKKAKKSPTRKKSPAKSSGGKSSSSLDAIMKKYENERSSKESLLQSTQKKIEGLESKRDKFGQGNLSS